MTTTYPNRWLSSEMQGAPQHEKLTEGLLISTLKTLLVTGFGELVADSVIYDTEKNCGKATFGSGHSYLKDSVIEISGAIPEDYNGMHNINLVSSTDVWFDLDTVPADATGTITMCYPSLGWSMPYESDDGLIGIFKTYGDEGDVFLRIDNSQFEKYSYNNNSYLAKVQSVSDVVDIDTYTLECSSYTSYDNWMSSSKYQEYDENWKIVGNNLFFHWFTKSSTVDRYSYFSAGYIETYRPADRYHFLVNGGYTVSGARAANFSFYFDESQLGCKLARQYSQVEGGVVAFLRGPQPSYQNSDSYGFTSPNPVDNSYLISMSKILCCEGVYPLTDSSHKSNYSKLNLRGTIPLMFDVLTNIFAYNNTVMTANDHKLLIIASSISDLTSDGDYYTKQMAFDITPVEV